MPCLACASDQPDHSSSCDGRGRLGPLSQQLERPARVCPEERVGDGSDDGLGGSGAGPMPTMDRIHPTASRSSRCSASFSGSRAVLPTKVAGLQLLARSVVNREVGAERMEPSRQ